MLRYLPTRVPRLFGSLVASLLLAASFAIASDGRAEPSSETAMTVFKSPYCGCCAKWVDYMREHGFDVTVRDMEELDVIKRTAGVPGDLEACHTATIDGYVIEGHVPVEAVQRLLGERTKVRGLAVPGMPAGSPGMESPRPESYSVYSFEPNGERTVYMSVPAR